MHPTVRFRLRAVRTLAAALALSGAAAGCGMIFSKPTVKGSGREATASLPAPAAFHALRVGGALEVEYTESPDVSLVVVADDNLHALLLATVEGGTLHLRTEQSWESQRPFLVRVGGATLDSIEVSGACTVRAAAVRGDAARITTSGASSIAVGDVRARELTIDASGSSSLETSGEVTAKVTASTSGASKVEAVLRVPHADVDASGASKLRGLSTGTAKVRTSGSASVDVDVRETLVADATGASSIFYGGEPALEGAASHASKVERK